MRNAEITTRIVQAVLIPRSDLAQGKPRKELDLPGIYFLFGEGDDEAKPIDYIGQTEDARTRLESHNKRRMFWKTAVFFVSDTSGNSGVTSRDAGIATDDLHACPFSRLREPAGQLAIDRGNDGGYSSSRRMPWVRFQWHLVH